jgi:hypothetical protein
LHPARVLLKANGLQLENRHFKQPCWAVTALLLAILVLLLDAMAACPVLHELIHHDADEPGHECAVTLFAHGQVDSVTMDVPVIVPAATTAIIPQRDFSVFAPAIQNLPAGRGPPVFSAIS